MYCRYCGEVIPEDSEYCSFCGRNQNEHVSANNTPLNNQESLAAQESSKKTRILKKIAGIWKNHKKLIVIVSLVLVAIITASIIVLPKLLHKNPVSVLGTAGTTMKTHFGLEYDIAHCGFEGKNMIIRMKITNDSSDPITLDSGTFDNYSELYDMKTKRRYSIDDQATSNYRMYSTNGSLFATSVVQTLQPGSSYEYDAVFTVSDENAEISDYLLSLYPFGPGEDDNHFSHFYTFYLRYIK